MSARELVVLGTASQVPTRRRAHHGALLRWDDEGVLLDPGEGTQRQLTLAGVPAGAITRICITHLHGDHCLGLPGILQRLALDGVERPVDLYFPAAGQEYVDRLVHASVAHRLPPLREHAVSADGVVDAGPAFTLHARALDHPIPTYGWRFEEPVARRMRADLLAERGIHGPDVGRLVREGVLDVGGRRVRVEEVSEPRPGQVFAFVMDTRVCRAAVDLAQDADLLVCESTFLAAEGAQAAAYGHLSATDAAGIAAQARARRLVLTHYSQRHPDEARFAEQARVVFPETHAARDLDRIPVPARR
ncbi:MAG TPA: ribonuclease Z [Intrasporangium sp.]|uniref:ribonuclease Z n=1 Tax=Intrasporangium sp. TaxID=1925024 RepID=UPI002D77CECC|nr:ribonuclease Z [Intrasporangium sp.]HET7397703.1 ribonuclease Z [Intrasporangium sp.]